MAMGLKKVRYVRNFNYLTSCKCCWFRDKKISGNQEIKFSDNENVFYSLFLVGLMMKLVPLL